MIDAMTQLAANPVLPIWVLVGAAVIVVTEATRASRHALWGDMFVEDLED